ncbi:LuxR C-terminal-related transcriptional regulator [Actinomycetospora corticicola]|uniref:DNA-binding NarL/FixJ family response regulator n=1 Tax=Actinomycetospora corticicola TaxID=663602 RepID=A0A7Y9J526_9PSEU|nr:LuxR family transcriptional regulator [Actinomycetospora corticicola]NYD35723.1 DNA-binding NarL/FixJ family response regulator [Actinomycetospora corticicola]
METWPFTEREDVLAAATRAVRDHGAVVLGGPAGVGKSRLARELVARSAGPVVGTARATASAQEIPLGALVDLLPRVTVDAAAPGVDHVRAALDALGAVPGGLIVVDDAHLLDETSATVVHQLAHGGRARLVVTLRSGEPTPDAVTALWKDAEAPRIDLAPFTREQSAVVLETVLGGPLEARTARLLHETAGGNALWLRHLVEGERAAGRLARRGPAWVWTGEVDLSPALRDLLDARIGTLNAMQRRVLELLAVAEPLGLGMLGALVGEDVVEDVAERGLVTIAPDGARYEVRLAHPLYGESVRAAMSVPRARRVRGELSRALARTGARRAGDDLRRAVLDLGSDRPLDPEELIAASVQASGLRDFGLAERLLRAAVAAGGGFAARLALAHLLDYQLRVDEADSVVDPTDAGMTDVERHQAVMLRGLSHHFQLDPPRSGPALVTRDEAAHHGGRPDPAYDGLRALFLGSAGQVRESRALAEGVLADERRPDEEVALAVFVLGLVGAVSGTGDDLRPLVQRGIEAARHGITATVIANIGYMELLDADLRGDPARAQHRLDWIRGLSGPQASSFAALYEGRIAISRGRPRRAIRALESALPSFPGHGGGWGGWSAALVAQCHGALGDGPAARAALADAETRRHPHIGIVDFEYDLARAWAAAASGRTQEAVEACRTGAARCRDTDLAAAEVLLRQTAVRLGDREQAGRLGELDRRLRTPRSGLARDHAEALAAQDPERFLQIASRLEDAGMVLEAADAAARAATVARADRRLVLAAEAEQRARTLAAGGEGARTPAVLAADAPMPLSDREREIALLAGEGLTNRQIAERLHVSVRTVESHVYRACTRLGLADRSALAAVARADRVGRTP